MRFGKIYQLKNKIDVRPMEMGISITPGGKSGRHVVRAASTSIKTGGKITKDSIGKAPSKATSSKQVQSRMLRPHSLGREIKVKHTQVDIQQIRMKYIHKEVTSMESEAEEAVAIETQRSTKHSNEQLCAWFKKNLRFIYYQTYTMTVSLEGLWSSRAVQKWHCSGKAVTGMPLTMG